VCRGRASPTSPPGIPERLLWRIQRGAESPRLLCQCDTGSLGSLLADGACVLDVRAPESFDDGHLHGALNLPVAGAGFGTRAGWATDAHEQVVIVSSMFGTGEQVAERLYAAGVWNLAGIAVADPRAWTDAGLNVVTATALRPSSVALALERQELQLLDVRDPAEWSAGHVPGSLHLPLSELGDGRRVTLPSDRPIAVACASGARAALAASVLRRRGHQLVSRVLGGVPELARNGVSLVVATR
jgi:hydroxyacylglutathione hydrolase